MTLAAVWSFLKRVPYWVWLALGGLILGWAFVEAQKAEAVRRNNEKNERERLEEQARVDETRRGIDKENQDASQRADEAVRSLPRYRATDELRHDQPGTAEIVLGPASERGS